MFPNSRTSASVHFDQSKRKKKMQRIPKHFLVRRERTKAFLKAKVCRQAWCRCRPHKNSQLQHWSYCSYLLQNLHADATVSPQNLKASLMHVLPSQPKGARLLTIIFSLGVHFGALAFLCVLFLERAHTSQPMKSPGTYFKDGHLRM